MKKIIILFLFFAFSLNLSVFANADKKTNYNNSGTIRQNGQNDSVIKNKLFSVALPAKLKGTYEVKKTKDTVSVYHKESKKQGFGGFAFSIEAYKNPADYASAPGCRKIGELTDKKGVLYDMVIFYPTDVQHDYTKNPEAPQSYMELYNLGENVNIRGVKGATYFKNKGMKGEDLYGEILQKHLTVIKERWDSVKLEKENMSYMYNVIGQTNKNPLNKIGYIYYDVNADGIEELLIGERAEGSWKGVIYDIYTMVDRKPQHVVSGGSRNRYFVCNDSFICNEYSSGAMESGLRVYILIENSTELFPQVSFKYDGYANPQNPYFLSYGTEGEKNVWENVSEEKFKDREKTFKKYKRFDFIPFSKFSESKK